MSINQHNIGPGHLDLASWTPLLDRSNQSIANVKVFKRTNL